MADAGTRADVADEASASPPRARIPKLLRDLDFRRYWTAQSISYLGDQVTIVALPLIAVVVLHASAFEVGALSALGTLPNLLFALHTGAFTDRVRRRRRLMVTANLLSAALLASIPLAYALGTLSLPQLYVVAFGAGSLAMLFTVAASGLFASLVPKEHYVQANTLIRGSYSFSWTAGPSLSGVLIQVISAPIVLLLDVASFLGSGYLLGRIDAPDRREENDVERGGVREGLRWVRRVPALLAKFSADTALNFSYSIYFALVFLFAVRELHLAPGLIGLVLGAGAIGSLLGTAAAAGTIKRLGVGRAFFFGAFVYPAALLLAPLAQGPHWLAASLLTLAEFLSGFGLMVCDITGSSIQQSLTPDRYRARAQGVYLVFNNGSRPLGALAGGLLGTWLGIRPTLVLAAVLGVVCVAALIPSPLWRMRALPEEAA
jgi:MFS family permease